MLNLLKTIITIKIALFVNTLITAYRVRQTTTKGGPRFFKQVVPKLTSFTFYGMLCIMPSCGQTRITTKTQDQEYIVRK